MIKNFIIPLIIFTSIISSFESKVIFADHLDEFNGELNLSGQVINGTELTNDVVYEIKLMATQNSSSELVDIEIIQSVKDFKFNKVVIDEAFTYFIMVTHQGIPTIIFIEDIDDPDNIIVTVYDRVFTPKDIDVIDYSIMIPHISPESDIVSVLGLISFLLFNMSALLKAIKWVSLASLASIMFSWVASLTSIIRSALSVASSALRMPSFCSLLSVFLTPAVSMKETE